MKVTLHPDADASLRAAAQWYENRLKELGERFLFDAIDALLAIEKNPHRFARARYRSSREIRRRLLVHFPCSVAYEVAEKQCIVLAVAHVARKPGYWRDRLR